METDLSAYASPRARAEGRWFFAWSVGHFVSFTILFFLAPPLLRGVLPADWQLQRGQLATLLMTAAVAGVMFNMIVSAVLLRGVSARDRRRGL